MPSINEQANNVPMPPMLANQLQQQKTMLQQVLSGTAQKGTNVQASPVVQAYIQYAIQNGLFQGGDINKVLSGFDQFFIKKNQDSVGQQLQQGAKSNVVAPPTALMTSAQPGLIKTLPGQSQFNAKDPFGLQNKAAQIQAQKQLAARRAKEAEAPKQIAKPGEQSDFEKRLAAKQKGSTAVVNKESKLAELIFKMLLSE